MRGKYDFITFTLTLVLVITGLCAIYSATASIETGYQQYFIKQVVWVVVGLILMIVVSVLPIRTIRRSVYLAYGITIFLLLVIFLIGKGKYGPGRWIMLGPMNLQPAELAKVTTVLAISKFLSDKYADINKFKYFAITILLIFVPFILIVRQPDLGTATVFLAIIIPLLFWAGLNWFNIFIIVTPFLTMLLSFNFWPFLIYMIVFSFLLFFSRKKPIIIASIFILNITVGIITPTIWNQLRPYQQKRIITFLNPEKDPKGAGYQIIQSQVAIGSGRFWGKGYLKGTQTQLRFLPAQHTDFIFSVIGEEFGFFGVSLILILFLVLIFRLINLAILVKYRFDSLSTIGFTAIITFHIIINIGMTVGMAPVTGIPLPFLSYGGSFLLSTLLMMGIILNFSRNRYLH
jgi:rod shape determining protein RodA